jgi:meiotically up-regulated gene 157 (Mug157) protein
VLPDRETFVHTGDIDDLWLRDSAAQVHPLLVPVLDGGTKALVQVDERLDRIVSGLVKRTGAYIRHDPYANAFRIDDTYVFSEEQKKLGRHDLISTWN